MANKIICSSLAMLLTISVWSQEVGLKNVTISQKNSKTIFIGVDNKFKVEGFENIQKIESSSPVYSRHVLREDTLIIMPHAVGIYTLTFHTKGGTQQVNFNTRLISDVSPTIGGIRHSVAVDKNEIIAQGKVVLSPYKEDEIFFENYKVVSYEAHVGNQVFSVVGETLSDELVTAIRKAKGGDKLMLTSVKAFNTDIGRTITSSGQYSFELK